MNQSYTQDNLDIHLIGCKKAVSYWLTVDSLKSKLVMILHKCIDIGLWCMYINAAFIFISCHLISTFERHLINDYSLGSISFLFCTFFQISLFDYFKLIFVFILTMICFIQSDKTLY